VGGVFFSTAEGDFNHVADFTVERIHKMSHPQSTEELEKVILNWSSVGKWNSI